MIAMLLALAAPAPAMSDPALCLPVGAEYRGIVLPQAATALTLSGLNFNLTNTMPRQFGGLFAGPPYAGKCLLHTHSDAVALRDLSGTTTFVLTREELPLWRRGRAYAEDVRRAMKAKVESAYRRPGNDSLVAPFN